MGFRIITDLSKATRNRVHEFWRHRIIPLRGGFQRAEARILQANTCSQHQLHPWGDIQPELSAAAHLHLEERLRGTAQVLGAVLLAAGNRTNLHLLPDIGQKLSHPRGVQLAHYASNRSVPQEPCRQTQPVRLQSRLCSPLLSAEVFLSGRGESGEAGTAMQVHLRKGEGLEARQAQKTHSLVFEGVFGLSWKVPELIWADSNLEGNWLEQRRREKE